MKKRCKRCGREFQARSRKEKYCPVCRERREREIRAAMQYADRLTDCGRNDPCAP